MVGEEAARPGAEEMVERLRRLQQLGVRRGLSPRPSEAKPPAPPPSRSVREIRGDELAARVGGEVVQTPFGPCLLASRRYALNEARAGLSLETARGLDGAAVAACGRDERLASCDWPRSVFLDTETSGLSGGAGTFAFMVGIGLFEGDAFVVYQAFMRHPGEERALLSVVSDLVSQGSVLVTFNGRSFDAPLLATRYALHRERSPLAALPHFDLLPAARQRWRLRLSSCALSSLEREVLAFARELDDVPGWLIPSIYQHYAGSYGAPDEVTTDQMARVFYHNREDIVSMVPLAARLTEPFAQTALNASDPSLHPAEWVGLARCYEELGWHAAGERAYRQALAQPLEPALRGLALERLASLLKRQARRDEAAAVWVDWITSVPGVDVTPYEELAKHYEWHASDVAAARKWTLWALHTARQAPPGPARDDIEARLRHRLARLEGKGAGEGK